MLEMILLKGRATEGMFNTERTIHLEDFEGNQYTLFVSRDLVQELNGDEIGLWVRPLDEKGDLVLVRLPSEALEARRAITVRKSQLHKIAA